MQSVHSHTAGYCEEQEWIDLSTVKGYCRTVTCQEVRDELELNLPQLDCDPKDKQDEQEEEWQRTLIGMCEGRLLPTPWLNKVVTTHMSTASHTYVCTYECTCLPSMLCVKMQTPCGGCHVCLCLTPSKFAEAVLCCLDINHDSQPLKQDRAIGSGLLSSVCDCLAATFAIHVVLHKMLALKQWSLFSAS